MKAYKVEMLVIDFDGLGEDAIKEVLENIRYPNDCIYPQIKKITEKDIGEWTDEHPLNSKVLCDPEYNKLFGN
jgi:hypothetical protein